MKLENKTILILSPQKWSNMFVSKHHYAIELAKRNNTVFFLQPSSSDVEEDVKIESLQTFPNIHVIHTKNFRGASFRFHFRFLYKFILSQKIKIILKTIHQPLDVVLSFDNTGKFPDLSVFKATTSIFFPVDQINTHHLSEYKNYGNHVFSISPIILDSFKNHDSKKVLLNHGLGNHWVSKAIEKVDFNSPSLNKTIQVGYFGNLAMGKTLDMSTLKNLINSNPSILFHFWGSHEPTINSTEELNEWINFLKTSTNVILYGSTPTDELVKQIDCIDVFLLCYDYKYDINKCSNSHKILEYLGAGKVIVSTRISMYEDKKELLNMLPTFDNEDYAQLFKDTIENLAYYNSIELQQKRKEFALQNTYTKQLQRIEEHLK